MSTKPALKTLYDEPGPRGKALNLIISAACLAGFAAGAVWILSALSAKGQLAPEKWLPFLTADMWRTYLLPGSCGEGASAPADAAPVIRLFQSPNPSPTRSSTAWDCQCQGRSSCAGSGRKVGQRSSRRTAIAALR